MTPTFLVHSFSHAAFCFAVAGLGGSAFAPLQIRQTEMITAVNTADLASQNGNFIVNRSLTLNGYLVRIKLRLSDIFSPEYSQALI